MEFRPEWAEDARRAAAAHRAARRAGAASDSDSDAEMPEADAELLRHAAAVVAEAALAGSDEEEEEAEEEGAEMRGGGARGAAAEEAEAAEPLELLPPDARAAGDTTAAQAAAGRDPQGIPWETTQWTRAAYRAFRDAEYASYYNREAAVRAGEPLLARDATRAAAPPPGAPLVAFARSFRAVRPTIVHFQLRNLLAAPAPDELLFVAGNRVLRWRARAGGAPPEVVLDASGARAGGGGANGNGIAVAPAPAQLCTLAASPDGLVAAGGFAGELLAARPGAAAPLVASLRLADGENGITNALAAAVSPSGAPLLVASNNDGAVRLVDATTFARPQRFEMPWAVNCAAAQPGGRLICAVGDDPDARVFDPSAGARPALALRGHLDFSFAAAWHPGGLLVATGNQDRTTRLYDLRAPARPLALLRARIGAVRALRFSPDGALLAAAEPADYVGVHAAGPAGDWGVAQAVDLFGEVAGIAFSPEGSRLWVAVSDVHYAGAVQLDVGGAGPGWAPRREAPPPAGAS